MSNPQFLTGNYKEMLLEGLRNPDEAEQYINAALEEGDDTVLLLALRDVAEAYGISQTAPDQLLSQTDRSHFSDLIQILNALGLQLVFKRKVA
ncbi:MAG: transcriptional regulator [Acidobacteria bacterium]|nr:transcriptional regulator [Acidobacteriota bacterium]